MASGMDKYDELKCIGRGSYGSAHLVQLKGTSEKYVIKKIPMELLTEKEKVQSFHEVELLSKLKHPNVVEYKENFVVGNVIHIVMAYCDGGDLAGKIRDQVAKQQEQQSGYFDIGQILDWFVQMAMAIKYLHGQRILHRDLKTNNIFLTTENVVKLGDFGIAKTLDSTLDQAKTVVGTPYYMSPEVCESKPYSYASDVWSLGCVFYEMVALKHAFDAPNILTLILKIVQQDFGAIPPHYDSEIYEILKKLLDKCPERRPTMEQIFMIPYIRNHMQGLVASGGSFRINPVVRRPHGGASSVGKRRVHAKNIRRSSTDAARRKPSRSQWMPIVAYDRQDDDDDNAYDEDLQLLDASIEDESAQLAFRPPERSSTPEPLTASPEDEEKSPVRIPLHSDAAAEIFKRGTAWTESTLATDDDGEVEEDMDARFQAKVEELMNPDFQNEYSEEFMDSQQIFYAPPQSKSRRSRQESSSSTRESTAPATAAPAGRFRRAQRPSHGNGRRRSSAAASADAIARAAARLESDETIPIRGRQVPLAALASDDDPASAYEKWGTSVGIEEDLSLVLDLDSELSGAGATATSASASIGSAPLSESGILRELEMEAESSCDESDDPYTSQSDYDADENFYSDDSEFYEENETEYSDDFEDSDAEVIEYSNDEFESSIASLQGESMAHAAAGLSSPTPNLALATPLSPNGSRRQKSVTTEVQWVMRNVAQSLLQPYEGEQPPVA